MKLEELVQTTDKKILAQQASKAMGDVIDTIVCYYDEALDLEQVIEYLRQELPATQKARNMFWDLYPESTLDDDDVK